jgi:UMF1 family MFS transporter
MRDILRRDVISWGLYDFANTIYSMNIISLYFATWLVIDLGYPDLYYSIAFSASMLFGAVTLPAFGYLSDKGQRKRLYLLIFTIATVISVVAFSQLPHGTLLFILFFFALSNFFYEGGIVFYNALLFSVSEEHNRGAVSGFGVALGYLGSVVGMILVLPFVTGGLFGLDIPFMTGGGKSGAFLPTALFFALFAVPVFLFVREKKVDGQAPREGGIFTAYSDVWRTLKATREYPGLLRFLISDFFFEDAIATVIIFMAVYTEKVLGLKETKQTIFFIVSTLSAMVGAYILGKLADRYSSKRTLFAIVVGWIASLIIFTVNSYEVVFWILGPVVGILLGGVWAVSRPLLMVLSPKEKLGEVFGLFSLSGRSAAVFGPLLWGGVVMIFSAENAIGGGLASILGMSPDQAVRLPYRLAVLALALMMALGLYIFRKVPDRKIHHDR